jgi:hypothetical protein
MARKKYADDTITGTMYPDDRTVVERNVKHIKPILKMIEERNKDPKLWVKIPKICFDWEKIF